MRTAVGTPHPDGPHPPLVLASASPRRSTILTMLGLPHEVLPADVAEAPGAGEGAAEYAERLACDKARAVSSERPEALVLGGDTVVAIGDRILEKPGDPEEALDMLLTLTGREHTVHSGLALAVPGGGVRSGVTSTRVLFRRVDEATARAYVATGEPMDKAGGYGIQGPGAGLVERVEGDFYAVMGLPVSLLVRLLDGAGWHWPYARLTAPAGGTGGR